MHEMGIVRDLVRKLEEAARDAGATRISGAVVWLGALTHFSAEHFRQHFAEETRGTLAQGAALEIEISQDVGHPHAQDVMMRCIDLDGNE
jgi:hydrogenase nickel incorporation protein HypA/HybF